MIVGLSFVCLCSVESSVNNLFLMAIICDRLPWDLAVTCAISSSTGINTLTHSVVSQARPLSFV